MTTASLALFLSLVGALQSIQPQEIVGTLNERLVSEDLRAQMDLKPATDRDLPGVVEGDRVFALRLPQFRPAGASEGLPVAFVETKDGGFLFVDTNVDGQLTASERVPYTAASSPKTGKAPGACPCISLRPFAPRDTPRLQAGVPSSRCRSMPRAAPFKSGREGSGSMPTAMAKSICATLPGPR